MRIRKICAGLIAGMLLFTGCAGKKSSSDVFRLVLADMSSHDEQAFLEQVIDTEAKALELLETGEQAAVSLIRSGDADCGYGRVSGDDPLHYGILKSDVIKRTEMLFVSEKRILHPDELSGLIIGYPDDMEKEFVDYLHMIPELEMHSYLSEEQLKKDLKSGLLDLAAADSDTAFEILEYQPDTWQISQPYDMPKLEYRFFAASQEALDRAEAFRKENR